MGTHSRFSYPGNSVWVGTPVLVDTSSNKMMKFSNVMQFSSRVVSLIRVCHLFVRHPPRVWTNILAYIAGQYSYSVIGKPSLFLEVFNSYLLLCDTVSFELFVEIVVTNIMNSCSYSYLFKSIQQLLRFIIIAVLQPVVCCF
jgi:hypothetical protein